MADEVARVDALEQSRETQIMAAIDALDQGLAVFDQDHLLVHCNEEFRSTHPVLDALLQPGLPWPVFVGEAARRNVAPGVERIAALVSAGLTRTESVEVATATGRWTRISVRPTKAGGFVLSETDVTEAHAIEELRGEADDLMRSVLDACSAYVMMTRVGDGEILYRMPVCNTLFGPVKSSRELYCDIADRSDFLADLLPTGAVDAFETFLKRKDGTPIPVRMAARMVEYGGEDVIVASIHDMSQLYGQRDEIVRINQRLFDAIEALDQGFALFDAEDRLVLANRRYTTVNQAISDLAVPGTPNAELVAAARERGSEPRAAGRVEDEDKSVRARYEFSLPDGREFMASRRPTSDNGFVLAWRDISERKAAERELARRREASQQNEKLTALGELLAGIAHELNNPLSVIVGQALMLREETDDPETGRRVDKISVSAERCAKIVKTFLAMARQRPASRKAVCLESIIETALDVAAHGLKGSGGTITTRFEPETPYVFADEDQIAQVFINLIVNAEQALAGLDQPAQLTLSTEFDPSDGMVVARVSDNGPGVPEHLRGRIFEPFFTTKEVGEGTGVGLPLCHRIITTHDGSIEVGIGPGGGAAFVIRLPRADEEMDEAAPPEGSETRHDMRALLVEDEPAVAEIMVEILQGLGVAAHSVSSVDKALARLDADPHVDLILSDVKMPGRSGRELLEEIEQRWPHLVPRMAFMTGDSLGRDASAILNGTDRPLLEKPVTPADVRDLVTRLAAAETGIER